VDKDSSDQFSVRAVSRRELLRGSALLTLGAIAAACSPASAPVPPTTPPAPAATPAAAKAATAAPGTKRTVVFQGWDYFPELVQENVTRFQSQVPDVAVSYTPIAGAEYRDKMLTQLRAKTPLDVIYVRDDYLGGWVEAGLLQPIEDLPGLDQFNRDMYPNVLDAMKFGDHQYGLPYFTDHALFAYNTEQLKKAGLTTAPETLDDLKQQSLQLKKAGVAEFPLLVGFKLLAGSHREWWTALFASNGHLFDQENNPVFPDKDPTMLGVLEWFVQAMQEWKILDPRSLELNGDETRDVAAAGGSPYQLNVKLNLQLMNDPAKSKTAGQWKPAWFPALEKGKERRTMGWTRLYALPKNPPNLADARKLITYMGAKDASGDYFTAKWWYLKRGVGYGYTPVDKDPEVSASTDKWGDSKLFSEMGPKVQIRDAIKTTWYSEWDQFWQVQMQNALLGKTKPRDALMAAANEAIRLKKESSG
jgi:multiple sugar transport system substrate-binding protein